MRAVRATARLARVNDGQRMCHAVRQPATGQESNPFLSTSMGPLLIARKLNPNSVPEVARRDACASWCILARMLWSMRASGRGKAEAAKTARNPRELAFWRHGAKSCYRFLCSPSPGPYRSAGQVGLSHPEPQWSCAHRVDPEQQPQARPSLHRIRQRPPRAARAPAAAASWTGETCVGSQRTPG